MSTLCVCVCAGYSCAFVCVTVCTDVFIYVRASACAHVQVQYIHECERVNVCLIAV